MEQEDRTLLMSFFYDESEKYMHLRIKEKHSESVNFEVMVRQALDYQPTNDIFSYFLYKVL
jgi:hypothetical protein